MTSTRPSEGGNGIGRIPGAYAMLLSSAAIFVLSGVLKGETRDAAVPLVTVFMKGAEGCAPRLLQEMQSEVDEIMRPAGISVKWRHLDLSQQSDPVPVLIVLTFLGACQSEGPCNGLDPVGPMGWTHVTDGAILPFCDILCDRVRAVLAPIIRCESGGDRVKLYGRALGRVAAHEFYHVLVNTKAHSRRGLAKPLLAASELAQDACHFGAAELARIRSAVARRFPPGLVAEPVPVDAAGQ